MLFVFGFVLAMFGFALLMFGGGPWLGGKRIPPRAARWTGAVWLSYFPLVFILRYALDRLELLEMVHPTLVYAVLAALCLVLGLVIITRATGRLPARQTPASTQTATQRRQPILDPPTAGVPSPQTSYPATPAVRKKNSPRPGSPEKNPFDFS
jgi:hypothetical protein